MMNDAIAREAFRDVLNMLRAGWVITGDAIVGPESAAVRLTQRHESRSEGHVDVQFVLDDTAARRIELWDCVAGIGISHSDRARFAAHLWGQTTAGALLELKYSLQGEFADHYHGADTGGFSGWHAIAGAIIGFGNGEAPVKLQQWWLSNPVLPILARALDESLTEEEAPFGLKILFGGDGVAEVRVNGERNEAASSALASLPWPRLEPAGFVRSYVILLHRERNGSGVVPD